MPPTKRPLDFILLITVLMLLCIGIVMVFSSSSYWAYDPQGIYKDAFYFLKRQLLWAVIGISAMFYLTNFPYQQLKNLAKPALIVSFVLLLLVLVPGIGTSSHGAQRWINLGPVAFQPSELIKICFIIYVAAGLAKNGDKIRSSFSALLPYLLATGAAALLILAQPDLGTAFTLGGAIFIMMFIAGVHLSILSFLALVGTAAVSIAIYIEPYRFNRLLAFIDPWKDPQGTGYHIIQSLLSLGSGGLLGAGLGQGKHSKLLFLPERHTDFIFAALGEELGFLGAFCVIILFLIFIWRGLKIAITSPDPFGSLLAAGIICGITFQAIINIGVVTGSLPVTGITLPFISFGGTSLIFTLIGVGIVLNISRYTTTKH